MERDRTRAGQPRAASESSPKYAPRGVAVCVLMKSTPACLRKSAARRPSASVDTTSRYGVPGFAPSTNGPARKIVGPMRSPALIRSRIQSMSARSPPISRAPVTPRATRAGHATSVVSVRCTGEPRDRLPARAASILAMSIFASSIQTCPCASRTRSPGRRRQPSHSSNQLVDALSNLGFVGHAVCHAHLVVASPARPQTAKPPLIFTFESSETTLGSGHPLHSARREKRESPIMQPSRTPVAKCRTTSG
jgi:hypothetical protein